LPSKYSSTHLYLFTGRVFPLLVPWSSDGDLTIFLHLFRQSDDVVQILPEAYSARPRPTLHKSRLRHHLCVPNIADVLAATFTIHRSSTPRLPPVLPPLLRCLFLYFITPAQMHVPHGRWHSNFAWHPGSECQTQPIVASIPFLAKLFLSFPPAQRLGFSQTAPLQSCLSSVCLPADTAFRPRNAEPAYRRFLPASLAPPAFHGSTLSGSAGCLQCQNILLLSRHSASYGCSQSLHIASPYHPAACGTWSRLVASRWTTIFPTIYLLPIRAPALLALTVAPTINSPSLLFFCRPFHQ
jgi:hypothetical protein